MLPYPLFLTIKKRCTFLDEKRGLKTVNSTDSRENNCRLLSSLNWVLLSLFASGKNSPEIAKIVQISLQTLCNHLRHINQKLRTHNRLEAVMHAIQPKLV